MLEENPLLVVREESEAGEERVHVHNLVEAATSAILHTLIIPPNSTWKKLWDWFIVVLVVWSSMNIPFLVAFDPQREQFFFPQMVDALFGLDILLSFRQAYIDKEGFLVMESRKIAVRYVRSWFLIDFLATMPFELMIALLGGTSSPGGVQFRRMLKILRMLRLGKLAKKTNSGKHAIASNAVRIVQLLFMFVIVAHWVACAWFYLGDIQTDSRRWLEVDGLAEEECDCLNDQYTAALYWALCTMTTVGYGDITPNTTLERWFAIFCILLGAIIYSSIFANVNILIQSFDSLGQRYRSQMEAMNELLRFFKVPHSLGHRVLKNVDCTWNLSGGFHLQQVMETIPWGLRVEVCMNLYEAIVRQAPMFQDAHRSLIQEIVIRLQPVVALKGDWIFREGDVGHEMLFVGRGHLEILAGAKADVLLTVVSEGSFFGETALFFTPSRRTASVRAATYAELFRITKMDFEDILLDFPTEREEMMRVAAEARERNDKIKQEEMEAESSGQRTPVQKTPPEDAEVVEEDNKEIASLPGVFASVGSRNEHLREHNTMASASEVEASTSKWLRVKPRVIHTTRSAPATHQQSRGMQRANQAVLKWLTAVPKSDSRQAGSSNLGAAPLSPEDEMRALIARAPAHDREILLASSAASQPTQGAGGNKHARDKWKKFNNTVAPVVIAAKPSYQKAVSITDNKELMDKIKESSLDRRTKKASRGFRQSLVKSVQASFNLKRNQSKTGQESPSVVSQVIESKVIEMDHRTEEMLKLLREIREQQLLVSKHACTSASSCNCICQESAPAQPMDESSADS